MNAREADLELEYAADAIRRDADFIACAPAEMLAANRNTLVEARERLNDALAKADRLKVAA